jgi:hypothetical protein
MTFGPLTHRIVRGLARRPRPEDPPGVDRVKRVALRIAMLVVAMNVWTGSPLLALWIGSRIQGDGAPQMGPVFVVLLCLAGFSIALAQLLARLGAVYDRMTGQTATVRRHVSWLRSMRGERPQYAGTQVTLTALEQTLVVVVVIGVAVFEIWFFFFSTSPIDQRSGRGAVPQATSPQG